MWGMFRIVDYCWIHFLKFYFFLFRDQFIHPLRIITVLCFDRMNPEVLIFKFSHDGGVLYKQKRKMLMKPAS